MKTFLAQFIGTLALVLIGCGAAVLGSDHVGQLGIALAFGFAIVAMAYGIGPVSGCHVNRAVSLTVFIAGRVSSPEMLTYWGAQFLGAVAGAAILALIAGETQREALDLLSQSRRHHPISRAKITFRSVPTAARSTTRPAGTRPARC